jgi:uncharacterized protein (TIGR02646 family)
MRKIDRRLCVCPAEWRHQVEKALPDYKKFLRLAAKFEKLPLSSPTRKTGFVRYAPQVLMAGKNPRKPGFPRIWGRHKEAIASMSHRKCVYCEGPINAPRAANVEHFKPKTLFPLLAYEWTNYFLGCTGCNGAKSSKWPKRGGYPRPDRGEPGRHFDFFEDGTVKAARPGSLADQMLEDFDLKRHWLNDERQFNIQGMLRLLRVAASFCKKGNNTQANALAKVLLQNVSDPKRAYSAALTQCFLRAWKTACPVRKA